MQDPRSAKRSKLSSSSQLPAEALKKEDVLGYTLGFVPTIDQLSVAATSTSALELYKSFIKPVNAFEHRMYRVLKHDYNTYVLENVARDFNDGIRDTFWGQRQVELVKPCVVPDISTPFLEKSLDIGDLLSGRISGVSQRGTWTVQNTFSVKEDHSWYMPEQITFSSTLTPAGENTFFFGHATFGMSKRFIVASFTANGDLCVAPSSQRDLSFNMAIQWLYLRGAKKEDVEEASRRNEAPKSGTFDHPTLDIVLYEMVDVTEGSWLCPVLVE